LINLI